MSEALRTTSEQIAGLGVVAELLAKQKLDSLILVSGEVMDVAALVLRISPDQSQQIVYASRAYDLWSAGHLVEPDLTAEEAVDALRAGLTTTGGKG